MNSKFVSYCLTRLGKNLPYCLSRLGEISPYCLSRFGNTLHHCLSQLGKIFRCLLLLISIVTPLVVQGQSATEQTAFVRFLDGEDQWQGRLQTGIVSYQNKAGVTLNLVSAIHIADDAYYQTLNEYFRSQDAVLYELVAEPSQIPAFNQSQDSSQFTASNRPSPLSFLQWSMASFLGVGFQLEGIDYTPDSFRHADVSPTQLNEIMQSKNENAFTMFLSLALAQTAAGQSNQGLGAFELMRALMADEQQTALKYLLAKELGNAEISLMSPELEDQLTVLGDRNQAALKVLRASLEEPELKQISLFYGAAHMPGIERAVLAELGFEKSNHRWLDAWIIP